MTRETASWLAAAGSAAPTAPGTRRSGGAIFASQPPSFETDAVATTGRRCRPIMMKGIRIGNVATASAFAPKPGQRRLVAAISPLEDRLCLWPDFWPRPRLARRCGGACSTTEFSRMPAAFAACASGAEARLRCIYITSTASGTTIASKTCACSARTAIARPIPTGAGTCGGDRVPEGWAALIARAATNGVESASSHSRIVQLEERRTLNADVGGSSPSPGATALSSRGLGRRPLTAVTRVRLPLGLIEKRLFLPGTRPESESRFVTFLSHSFS